MSESVKSSTVEDGLLLTPPVAQVYRIHPETPQARLIEQVRDALAAGAVMLYPTDTNYAIGCDLSSKSAIQRVQQLKKTKKPLTFLCPSLSNIAQYAQVNNSAYRLMKSLIPGPYTFILPATKLVPQLVLDPKRKTTGIRVPKHRFCQELLRELAQPLISTSAQTTLETTERFILFDELDKAVDLIVDDGSEPTGQVSTILDLTGDLPTVVREGLGWEAAARFFS